MDCESLYVNQLDREDLKSNVQNVVKWSYVDNDTYSGKFLIVTCKWCTKLWKRFSETETSASPENPEVIISPMFSAGDNNELKWEIQLDVSSEDTIDYCFNFPDLNGLEYDYAIFVIENDLSLQEVIHFENEFTDNLKSKGSIDLEDEYLSKLGRTKISILQGFVVDVAKFKNHDVLLPVDNLNSSTDQSVFKQLLENPLFSEITLIVGDEQLKAHRGVLAMKSQIFLEIFENSGKKQSHVNIEIKDFQLQTIKEVLRFMYTGELQDHGKESIKQIMLAGRKYAIEDLLLKSEKVLLRYLNVKNAPEFLELAAEVNAKNVKLSSINIIVNNIDKIDTLALSVLKPELLKEIFDKMATRKRNRPASDD